MLRLQFLKWILFSFIALWLHDGTSQGINNTNKVYIIGQVTKMDNNAPIYGQEITIISDTSYGFGFIYHKKLYTDKEGLFYDTISIDALKGALQIKTVDCFNKIHDTTVYYRFNWSENNILQANFQLPVELSTNSPQANFAFKQDPSGQNNLLYQFFDKSNEQDVLSWHWDFGDGVSSTVQHPIHTFPKSGLYRVSLSIVVDNPITLVPITSSIVKLVDVKLKDYYHLGGHVIAGYFPIDKGEAYLYKIEDKDYIIIDTAIFNDTLGFYLFPQLIEGKYIVKADIDPSSVLFNDYLQTYYNNKYLWEEADTIFHNSTSTEYDINMIPNNNQYLTGPGKLTGKIIYDAGQTSGKTGPACNIEIILFDENDVPVEICHSNESGFFELGKLDLQSYNIHAEVTGKFTIPLNVVLEPSTTEIDQITLIISSSLVHGSYTYGINDHDLEQSIGNVYPNPVSNNLNLDFSLKQAEQFDISIMDSHGRIVKSELYYGTAGNNSIHLNLEELSSGFYFTRINGTSGKSIYRKFLKN